MPDPILRTFIAIELDEPLRVALATVQNRFKRQAPPGSVRWVAPEGIHLTLKFLGDTPAGRAAEIAAALARACEGVPPFELIVEGRGCFPNTRRPRVIWAAVRSNGPWLAKLQAAVERYIAPLGWPTEERSFSPHLTLGRVARGAGPAAEAALGQMVERAVVEQIGVQRVTAVSFIKSDLRPAGAVYTTLVSAPLEDEMA
ncbi:MAG: 2',5' RNA ligase family [Chloroflexi bacterium ADurb.Bin325]|nr:MAG: 2',5' RNA ligase family [Chloroflexi bacterium ADurb.Bin325]